ncbi:hypothetical protein M8J75_003369 [Diaphorina citri]|nr:hypothetical protein M8J75_003369 [Diaphorina citri]
MDCHGGGGHAAPMKDQQQNYELLTGYQNDTHTVIRFSRAWDTCDSQDDLVLTEQSVGLSIGNSRTSIMQTLLFNL